MSNSFHYMLQLLQHSRLTGINQTQRANTSLTGYHGYIILHNIETSVLHSHMNSDLPIWILSIISQK